MMIREHIRSLLLAFMPLLSSSLVAAPVLVTSSRASVLVCGGGMMDGDRFARETLPALRVHYAGCRRIALVLHAVEPSVRDRMENRLRAAFADLGNHEAASSHREDAVSAARFLSAADGIFVGGGETFVLLRELYRAGELELIRERVLAGVPYGGSSAGANVAGFVIGTTNDFPVVDIPSRDALALFPAVLNPHHPGAEMVHEFAARSAKIRAYLRFNPDETVLALGNRAIARLHQGRVSLILGPAWLYRHDKFREAIAGQAIVELNAILGHIPTQRTRLDDGPNA